MARVSIVVPIYNVEAYLERNLESLRTQTYTDIRVLCINDGSTDDSQAVIDKFVAMDSRFESYVKENGGLSDARNYGLKYVNSEYVMFIDSDDFCEPEMVELCIKGMDKEDADMAVFAYNQYYVETNSKEKIDLCIPSGTYTLEKRPEILAKTPNAAWNKMYRTKLFIDNNIEYPFGYRHQDLGTTAKLMYHANKIVYINTPLYNYLIDRPNNITMQVDKKIYHIMEMCKEILDYYKKQGVFKKYYDELNFLVERNLIVSLRKSIKFKDRIFALRFIDAVFAFKKQYFSRSNAKYDVVDAKDDYIYLNKHLLKTYYLYKSYKK